MSKKGLQAYVLVDGGVFVRGTDDAAEAQRFIETDEEYMWALGVDLSYDPGFDYEIKCDVERTGWFRFNVQDSFSDYGWMLGSVNGPGRGRFKGVWFNHAEMVEIEYATDEEF